LSAIEPDLLALGYQIIAISPDSPDRIKESELELEPKYTLYSDASLAAADAFGVSWNPSEKNLVNMKENYGHDLVAYSGGKNKMSRLPVPSVFIITADGEISFHYADPSRARYRIPGDLLLAASKSSLRFHAE
jgi:peroxiredoxin